MPISTPRPARRERLDYQLLRESPVVLYTKLQELHEELAWFTSEGYNIRTVRAGFAASPEALIVTLGQLLSFPERFGKDLDAFSRCLNDIELPEPGMILMLEDFGTFAAAFRRQAQGLLDICACQSRRFLLQGRRFIILVHSKDSNIQFDPVGATPVLYKGGGL